MPSAQKGGGGGIQFRLKNLSWWAGKPGSPGILEHSRSNSRNCPHDLSLGDTFGESLGGSRAPLSFSEVPDFPRKFPELPRKFFGDFPGSSLTVGLNSNPGVPRKFPRLPRKFPDFPGGQPLSLGSLTPSPDSQKLSLKVIRKPDSRNDS